MVTQSRWVDDRRASDEGAMDINRVQGSVTKVLTQNKVETCSCYFQALEWMRKAKSLKRSALQ